MLQNFLNSLFYIAVATKNILNSDKEDKDRIYWHLNSIDPCFYLKFNKFFIKNGAFFREEDGSYTTHVILISLGEGYLPKYDPKLH